MRYNSVEDYVKNAENNRNAAILNSLLGSEPGMKELPEITAEDEGKILQVNNGSPSWSEAELTAALENKADVIVSSASGSIASFVDGADDLPMKSAVVSMAPIQDSNGYGIFPINSRTGLTVYRVGHELISIPQFSGSEHGCTLTVLDSHTIRISGTPSDRVRFSFPLSTNADFEFDLSTMRFFVDGAPNGFTLSVAGVGPRGGYKNFSIRVETTFSGEATDIGIHLYAKEDTSNTPEAYIETAYPVTWENKVCHSYDMQVVFNQLAALDISKWALARATISFTGQNTTITPTTSSSIKYAAIHVTPNHKILVMGNRIASESNFGFSYGLYRDLTSNNYDVRNIISNSEEDTLIDTIFSGKSTSEYFAIALATASTTSNYVTIKNLQVVDLTEMFGSTIANYIYSLEEANAGAGVAYFRKLFPNSYYDYNAGESMSVSVVSHDVYGGTVDLVSGVLKERPFIASYNGETLVGPWVSSMDAYDPNTTPTIGAQVVDMGGTETIYNLTPQEVKSLLGTNNVWSDVGTLSVTYRADTKLYIDNKITQAIAAALNS